MNDPLDELFAFFEQVHTRRFWGNILAGIGFVLMLLCISGSPMSPRPELAPLVAHLAAVMSIAGLALDDPPPAVVVQQRSGSRGL